MRPLKLAGKAARDRQAEAPRSVNAGVRVGISDLRFEISRQRKRRMWAPKYTLRCGELGTAAERHQQATSRSQSKPIAMRNKIER
jgi:hypothetical protein